MFKLKIMVGLALSLTVGSSTIGFAESGQIFEQANAAPVISHQPIVFMPANSVDVYSLQEVERRRADELRNLESRQSHLRLEDGSRRLDATARGTARLTPQERRALRQQINQAGHEIYVQPR